MDNSVILALIALGTVFVSGTIAPITVAVVQYRLSRAERKENNARQDALAVKTAETLAHAANVTNGKLDDIHTLVNSNMTAVMQSELDTTKHAMALMQEVIDLKQAAGVAPSLDALAAIATTREKINELTSVLVDRRNKA